VRDFNHYGGGYHTRGRIHQQGGGLADLGIECEFRRHWAWAFDLIGTWIGTSHFNGRVGVDSTGAPAVVGAPHSIQYSMAPAIEYLISENNGIIAGALFTFSGRNAEQFTGAALAFTASIHF
jgi:hypothetical protein